MTHDPNSWPSAPHQGQHFTSGSSPQGKPAKPKLSKKTVGGGIGILILGILLGSCGDSDPAPTSTPAPTETVEVPGPERVVEEQVEVPVTPDACLEALDLAEQGFDIAAEVMGIQQDALSAAASLDVAGIDAARVELEALLPDLQAIAGPFNSAKAECRAS